MGLSPAGLLLPEGPTGLASREEIIHALCARLATRGLVCSERVLAGVFVAVHERFLPEIGGFLELLPGVAAFAGALKGAGVRTAIVTSDTVTSTLASLEHLGVARHFDLVVGRDSTVEPKVSGVPALRAMEELGVEGSETVCLGDAPMDVVMGRAAGCRATIAVATGQVPLPVLREHTPYDAPSLEQLAVRQEAAA
jgi:phosphoglycolate phosphatase-like HAD superfamily hydrolase